MSSKIVLVFLGTIFLAAPYLWPPLFPLAWFGFTPFFWVVVRADSWRRSLFWGWLGGFLTHILGFFWLVYTIRVFGEFPYAISVIVFVIYAALQGLQMGLFAVLVKRVGLGPFSLFPALFWVAIEFWFPLLFPWYLANSQLPLLSFIQTADLVGPYGASFLVMWFNAVTFAAFLSLRLKQTARWGALLLVVAFIIASVAYGTVRLGTVTAATVKARKLSVAAVQGNIGIDLKWNPLKVKGNLQAQQELTKQAADVKLVIWPESAVEIWLPETLALLPSDIIPPLNANAFFIFGARSYGGLISAPDFKAFNTAFLSDGAGRILGRYHKQVLLAFGEYLPFSSILSKLPAVPFADGFTPGDGPHTLDLPGMGRMAPLICYEDLMPELSRAFVKSGKANILVNLTNDAWYGRTVAPWQHARLAQWRAIETRRTLVRVTNTGITSVIDATGEMIQSLPVFSPGILRADVALLDGETLYVRFGDWFAWSATLLSVAVLLLSWKRRI
jgi:apolipoprotein N-acyltransferase